jgi:hypothetical protein
MPLCGAVILFYLKKTAVWFKYYYLFWCMYKLVKYMKFEVNFEWKKISR